MKLCDHKVDKPSPSTSDTGGTQCVDRRFGLVEKFLPQELKGKVKGDKPNEQIYQYAFSWCWRYNTQNVWSGTPDSLLKELSKIL